ncbi:hypothetical protein [Planomonospora venezuelensis]|uniref:DUF1579 domain-containing protein n=1 Tax=Planomonospora venezuelensis TaxID=1999 RepID=A0A841DCB2_PLAVE|nr:hypothetical protein [Planomonospora venezuelensis]MBB5965745.1 hypothetical protein [Planomonospora venezuelensis]GIM62311.1 hypothetical protein Pve01_75440 [Planomonospora venezuelensis]
MSDFDFLIGSWNIANRKLVKPLSGSDEWEEFPSTAVVRPMFGGAANIEEITFPTRGSSGLTLRLFDVEREEWSLYWGSSVTGTLFPPVVGRFTDGRGEFYGDDAHEGAPIRARFVWSEITENSARWEQAFSADGEKTWETNWIMEFTRA